MAPGAGRAWPAVWRLTKAGGYRVTGVGPTTKACMMTKYGP